jgi:hypothetical protein
VIFRGNSRLLPAVKKLPMVLAKGMSSDKSVIFDVVVNPEKIAPT